MKTAFEQVEHLKSMSEYYAKQSELFAKSAEWFAEHGKKLEGLSVDHYGDFVHVQTPTREDLMRVLKAFPGKWGKSVSDTKTDKLDYSLNADEINPAIYARGTPIALVEPDDEETKANASRIIACINACADIQNPAAIKQLIEASRVIEGECVFNGRKYLVDELTFANLLTALTALDSPVPPTKD